MAAGSRDGQGAMVCRLPASREFPALETSSLLTVFIWPSEAGPDGQNRPALSAAYGTIPYALRAGNFSEPCKELNRAIREIFVLIREFRGSGIAFVTVGGVRPSRSLASHPGAADFKEDQEGGDRDIAGGSLKAL